MTQWDCLLIAMRKDEYLTIFSNDISLRMRKMKLYN